MEVQNFVSMKSVCLTIFDLIVWNLFIFQTASFAGSMERA